MSTASQIDGIISCLKQYKSLLIELGLYNEAPDIYIDVLEEEKYHLIQDDDEQKGEKLLWIGLLFQQLLVVWLWQEHLLL